MCATLVERLAQRTDAAPVICCLVGEHTDKSPAWIVRSILTAGLKAHPSPGESIFDRIQEMDLDDTEGLCDIFSEVAFNLAAEKGLFIIVDSLSFYAYRQVRQDTALVLKCLANLCRNHKGKSGQSGPIKVLISEYGILPASIAPKGLEVRDILVVPDRVY